MDHVQNSFNGWNLTHIVLASLIAAAYLSVPFTVLRRLPVTAVIKVSAMFFFATCAVTHLAMATGWDDSHWMILSDLVQFVAITTFIVSISRLIGFALARRDGILGLQQQRPELFDDQGIPILGAEPFPEPVAVSLRTDQPKAGGTR
jgi:hypothetical protein